MLKLNARLVRLSRRLEPIWTLAATLLRLDRPQPANTRPLAIVVFDLHLIGDAIMLIPLLRALRRAHPTAHLAVVAGPWARTVLGDTDLMDEFVPLRAPWVVPGERLKSWLSVLAAVRTLRRRSWDWGLETRGDVRNILLIGLARAKRRIAFDFSGGRALLTDVVPDDGRLKHIIDHHALLAKHLGIEMTDEERVPRLVIAGAAKRDAAAARRVGFHFGASKPLKRMPVAEALTLLGYFEKLEHCELILFDAPDVSEFNVQLLKQLPTEFKKRITRWSGSLSEFTRMLPTLDQFYGMDSGPAHIAAALGVEVVTFFGPTLAMNAGPVGERVHLVELEQVRCRPCEFIRCDNAVHQQCMLGIASRAEALVHS
jgi:ADP-heptose:LPS heptosyltransferase